MNLKSGILSLFLLFCSFVVLMAQDPPPEQSADYEIYELFDVSLQDILNVGMVSASQKKQSVLDAPAQAYVITAEQIKSRGYVSLVDLMEDIPEIEIQRNSNPDYRNFTTIRGVPGNEKFMILLNGTRITPSTGDFYGFSNNFSLVNALRVEVIIGPASALYGADAFSGIVNIITRIKEGDAYEGVEANASYGSYFTNELSFNAGVDKGKVGILLSAYRQASEEPRYYESYPKAFAWYNEKFAPDGLVVESPWWGDIYVLTDFQTWAGASYYGNLPSQEFAMPSEAGFFNAEVKAGDFSFGVVRHYERHSTAYGLHPKYTTYDRDAFIQHNQTVMYGNHTYTSFDRRTTLQSTFNHSFFEIDPQSNYMNAVSRWQRGFLYGYAQSSKIQEQVQSQINDRLNITFGSSFEILSALPRVAPSPIPFDKTLPAADQEVYYIGAAGFENYVDNSKADFNDSLAVKQRFYQVQFTNFGAYAQGQWEPSRKMAITLGLRYDNNSRFWSAVNPRLGVVYKPNKKVTLKMLYGESILSPSPSKAFLQSGAFFAYDKETNTIEADFFHITNPELKPEKLRSGEFGMNWFISENLSLNLNGYVTLIYDLVDLYSEASEADLNVDNINATRLEISRNQGSTYINGLTMRLNHFTRLGKITLNSYLGGSYTDGWTDYEDESTGGYDFNFLFYQALFTAKGGIDINHPKFYLSPRFMYRDFSQSNLEDIVEFSYYNDPFIVMHLSGGYKIFENNKSGLETFFRINNLFDIRYYNVYVGSNEGMPSTPQDPRRIQLGLTLRMK